MEDRLISRFGWGLTVAIEPPELEMRVAILLKKAEAEGVDASGRRRVLRGQAHALQRARARRRAEASSRVLAFHRQEIRSTSPRKPCSDLLRSSRQISVDDIQKTVADYFKIKVSDMYSKTRSRNVARPRQIAMALAKELTQMSLPEIGEAFGGPRPHHGAACLRTIASLRKRTPDSITTTCPRAGAQRMRSCARTPDYCGNSAAAGTAKFCPHRRTCGQLAQRLPGR